MTKPLKYKYKRDFEDGRGYYEKDNVKDKSNDFTYASNIHNHTK